MGDGEHRGEGQRARGDGGPGRRRCGWHRLGVGGGAAGGPRRPGSGRRWRGSGCPRWSGSTTPPWRRLRSTARRLSGSCAWPGETPPRRRLSSPRSRSSSCRPATRWRSSLTAAGRDRCGAHGIGHPRRSPALAHRGGRRHRARAPRGPRAGDPPQHPGGTRRQAERGGRGPTRQPPAAWRRRRQAVPEHAEGRLRHGARGGRGGRGRAPGGPGARPRPPRRAAHGRQQPGAPVGGHGGAGRGRGRLQRELTRGLRGRPAGPPAALREPRRAQLLRSSARPRDARRQRRLRARDVPRGGARRPARGQPRRRPGERRRGRAAPPGRGGGQPHRHAAGLQPQSAPGEHGRSHRPAQPPHRRGAGP